MSSNYVLGPDPDSRIEPPEHRQWRDRAVTIMESHGITGVGPAKVQRTASEGTIEVEFDDGAGAILSLHPSILEMDQDSVRIYSVISAYGNTKIILAEKGYQQPIGWSGGLDVSDDDFSIGIAETFLAHKGEFRHWPKLFRQMMEWSDQPRMLEARTEQSVLDETKAIIISFFHQISKGVPQHWSETVFMDSLRALVPPPMD